MPSFQCAVITGACGGLGQSLARQLLGSGAQVALVGLNHDTLKALQALAPERCRIYTPDVSNAQAIQAIQVIQASAPKALLKKSSVPKLPDLRVM